MKLSTIKKHTHRSADASSGGEFVDFRGERYCAIRNVDRMPAFFISIVSNVDHWLFVASTGGLTAGRVSPETALFPYNSVDRIYESLPHTGPRTLLRGRAAGREFHWEPFNLEHFGKFRLSRNLYKSVLGNKLCFEEINHDLGLTFRYSWATSDTFGFIRDCELENSGSKAAQVELLDGLQNILPANTPRHAQANCSNLVDAYKWSELDKKSGLALFALNAAITDRAEPRESLKANIVYSLGFNEPTILLSSQQIDGFRAGAAVTTETRRRGIRGAFFVNQQCQIAPSSITSWTIVADVQQTQADIVALQQNLLSPQALLDDIENCVQSGSDKLARIMAANDGFQQTDEEQVTTHHYANVLFNVLRGGYFYDQYHLPSQDFRLTVQHFNKPLFAKHADMLESLPPTLTNTALLEQVNSQNCPQLSRLALEYLPITFGRRHGDPSRPWNQFAIQLKDDAGNPLLSYQGNWRDIFQNWEAIAFSYPEFVESMIAKFVNASTLDGYNPYRVTKEGIDWEVEDPDDPWSYIGYWGDHQIIYLLKLLELSKQFHPQRLTQLLLQPLFSYANVPYRIRPFAELAKDPKSTVDYDHALAKKIEQLESSIGADAKLLLDSNNQALQVTLLEKLLVPLLAKLANLVVGGGIWMNTQRPEWNDANNALVGQGLSMVTLYYMRRYLDFLDALLATEKGDVRLSAEVKEWLENTANVLAKCRLPLANERNDNADRYRILEQLGEAASQFRERAYQAQAAHQTELCSIAAVRKMLSDALLAIDHSIANNQRSDKLYHAYNILGLEPGKAEVETLYPMLEGQVAVLCSGAIEPVEAIDIIDALFASEVYRDDQQTFMLYPNRQLPSFLEKNRIAADRIAAIPLAEQLLADGDNSVLLQDAAGQFRFNADLGNVRDLLAALEQLPKKYAPELATGRAPLTALFEATFEHKAFTGRSGTMFGFEGLGCIYWHMVSKLLLATQECFFKAIDHQADESTIARLGQHYYRIRNGIGFNKTAAEYGAFPTDPYSHTTGHSGAQQPGMTGQVKEEVLSRFGELGVRVNNGTVRFEPRLLRAQEFTAATSEFRYLDVNDHWRKVNLANQSLAFSWCQVAIIYTLNSGSDSEPAIRISYSDGRDILYSGSNKLSIEDSQALFKRSGDIEKIEVQLNTAVLFPSEE